MVLSGHKGNKTARVSASKMYRKSTPYNDFKAEQMMTEKREPTVTIKNVK